VILKLKSDYTLMRRHVLLNPLLILLSAVLIGFFCVLPARASNQSQGHEEVDWSRSTRDRGFELQVREKQESAIQKQAQKVAKAAKELVSKTAENVEPVMMEVLTPYCMTQSGTGLMDCFDIERTICDPPESQYVIRSVYLPGSSQAATRYGQPFCSEPSAPVVANPVTDSPEAPPMPVVTLEDFRRLDIAPSDIESDSGGFGLIRANTNFFATEESQTLNTTMLGQQVAIQAIPVEWTWNYGDGSEKVSNPFPGGPQKEFNQKTTTSHVYEKTGEFSVSLSTAYRGQFSVNGGPWIAIPGVANVPSEPVTADIWRSQSKNVADDCNENPEGWACGNPFVEN
jgi:hypothetical protein